MPVSLNNSPKPGQDVCDSVLWLDDHQSVIPRCPVLPTEFEQIGGVECWRSFAASWSWLRWFASFYFFISFFFFFSSSSSRLRRAPLVSHSFSNTSILSSSTLRHVLPWLVHLAFSPLFYIFCYFFAGSNFSTQSWYLATTILGASDHSEEGRSDERSGCRWFGWLVSNWNTWAKKHPWMYWCQDLHRLHQLGKYHDCRSSR